MPTISMFYGIVIRMYYDDHYPSHFHALYGEYKGIFNFNGELIDGNMPNSKLKLIAAWSSIHKDELIANWKLAQNGETIYNINPLI